MNDRDYSKQKKRVAKYMDKWQAPMGLHWWDIGVIWDRSYNTNGKASAETDMNGWKYRHASITYYLPQIAEEKDDKEIEKVVVHELCHVLLSMISVNMENLNDHYQTQLMEFNTELVAQAFLWTYEAAKEEANAKV